MAVSIKLHTFTLKYKFMLTNDQIQQNWDEFLGIIDSHITDAPDCRWVTLKEFYTEYEQRIAFMPASSKTHFHSAFPGGHVSHTLRVYHTIHKLYDLWAEMGATENIKKDQLSFVAINHDIGKFGTYRNEYYIDQDSKWHLERGEVYKNNPAVPFMKDSDRSLFLLQDIGIRMAESEFLAIKLQAGLYEEANKSYFISYSPEFRLKSNLPYLLHQADAMSARIESVSGVVAPKPKVEVKSKKGNPSVNKFLKKINE